MKILRTVFKLVSVIVLSVIVVYCGKKDKVRSYSEEIPEDVSVSHGNFHGKTDPSVKVTPDIEWEIPAGWETVKNSSRLRIATFSVKLDNRSAECTLIPLHGDGGGLVPNTRMWYGTITGKDFADKDLDKFLKNQKRFRTKSGLSGILLDFSDFTSNDKNLSMMVSVITLPQKTLFVKLSGDASVVRESRKTFLKFSKSITLKNHK